MADRQLSHISSDIFGSIIATTLDGFQMVDTSGFILDVNDSYCRMMGYTREELVGRHISQVDAVDDAAAVARRSQEIIQQGALRFETEHRHNNGSIIAVEVSCNFSPSHGGIFFSFVRDITEQKATQEVINARLRLMEYAAGHMVDELLRQTLDEAEKLTGSCISFYHFLDPDQQTIKLHAWSTRTAAHFCRTENADIHYPISQAGVWADCIRECRPVIHNDYASLPQRKGLPAGHAEVVRELVVPVLRRGVIVAILGVGNKPTDYLPRDVEMVSLLADLAWGVADRKRLESQIVQSEERYRNIVEGQTELVDRYLPGGILTYVNPALVKFAGVGEEELLGKSFYPFIHEDDRDEAVRRIESITRDNPVVELESKIELPDGRVRWNRWTHTGFFDADGDLIEYQSVGKDITERKLSEQKLIKRDAEIEQLLHTVSHDLRGPLVTIKTFLGYLEKDMLEADMERIYEDLRYLNGSADKMRQMLDELLELSRIDRLEVVPVSTSLLDVVSEVVDTLAGVISERKVEILLPEADVTLFGDRPRLCRIWQNLIENAIKYSRNNDSPQIRVGFDRIGEEPVFFVRDNGIGIETQYQDRIFGLFEKLDSGSPGVGLGLPIIRRIVEKCGGRIWAESEGPGRGASFNFTLPDVVLAG